MGLETFLNISGLSEDFIKRLRDDKSEETLLPLIYTKPRIRKVCEEIKNYSKRTNDICKITVDAGHDYDLYDFIWTEEFNRDLGNLLKFFSIRFEFNKKVGCKLDKLYPGEEKNYKEYQEFENPHSSADYIDIWWKLATVNNRYWYTTIAGRPICAENFRKAVTEDIKYHENCQSPKEYKEFCGNLTRILRKHAFPYQKNENLHHP